MVTDDWCGGGLPEPGSAEDAVEALWEAGGEVGAPVWGSWRGRPGDMDGLVVWPEPSDLTGAVAPPDVWAIGVLAAATTRSLDDGGVLGRARVCCVVTRSGEVASRLVGPDGIEVGEAPTGGRFLDVMHRCLGLATAPAALPVAAGLGLHWLAAIAEAGAVWGTLGWDEAVILHPAWDAADGDLDTLITMVEAWGWEDVRVRCMDGRISLPGIAAELAGWMDAGMLCRWSMESLRRHDDLLMEARTALGAADWLATLAIALGDRSDPDVTPDRRRRPRTGRRPM